MLKPLSILFAGHASSATLVDGHIGSIWVRALPQEHLAHVIREAEHKHALVELCCYFKAPAAPARKSKIRNPKSIIDWVVTGAPRAPEIPPPAGYLPVPMGWSQNLDDASIDRLYEEVKTLNFTRAAKWAGAQIAAKKLVAPLHRAMVDLTAPVIEQLLAPLLKRLEASSASTPKSPPSPDTPASIS